MKRANRGLSVVALLLMCQGCAHRAANAPYEGTPESGRQSAEAERIARVAAETEDASEAERLLRKALALDLYCGMAHNNLGTILLERGELYEAANEFEWARKLMPGHPSPRMNLALTLERAGRTGEAIAEYRTALEAYPDHIQTMQALSRLQVRTDQETAETGVMLKEIALRGETPQWREWAAMQLSRRTP